MQVKSHFQSNASAISLVSQFRIQEIIFKLNSLEKRKYENEETERVGKTNRDEDNFHSPTN